VVAHRAAWSPTGRRGRPPGGVVAHRAAWSPTGQTHRSAPTDLPDVARSADVTVTRARAVNQWKIYSPIILKSDQSLKKDLRFCKTQVFCLLPFRVSAV